jgi:hypothetical protein
MIRTGTARTAAACLAVSLLAVSHPARAQFTVSVFAQGAAVSGTEPDSITTDGSHIWVEYSNGASSSLPPGTGGASTIAEYDLSGRVLNTFSVLGSADGLRYNAATNQIWALQNQDGNSALTTINATTGAIAHYSYTSQVPGRGFDDVQFVNGNAFMSYTNPNSAADPILVKATLGNGTISVTPVLLGNAIGLNTATGQMGPIVATDPDSLTLRSDGSLLLTSEADGYLTTIKNPGTGSQSLSFVSLVDATGAKLTSPDDVVFNSSRDQRLLVADTANNTIYSITGPFQQGGYYGSIGSTNSVDFIDPTTGVSTPITAGLLPDNAAPHGLLFIKAVPAPPSLVLLGIGAIAGLGGRRIRRGRDAA